MNGVADLIRKNQNTDAMLRRALERIIQLYTDKSHFVYELLQNAEDTGAAYVKFVQYDDRLEFYHDGKPFTSENLNSLCDIGASDKSENLNQIGEFGVGFKSVFGICDKVEVYSSPEYYHGDNKEGALQFAIVIEDFTRPKDIEYKKVDGGYTTKFVFPYAVGESFSGYNSKKELINALTNKLENLGITTLLFMKSMVSIKYEINLSNYKSKGEYLLEKNVINDHCSLVSAFGESIEKNNSHLEDYSYLLFSRKWRKDSLRTVDIAFPVKVDNNGNYECQRSNNPYVSVYFPTEKESKLDFIVQGPYRTTPNRGSIPADNEDNKLLVQATAALLRDSLIELKNSGKLNLSFLKMLPIRDEKNTDYGMFKPLHDIMDKTFRELEIIPTKDGHYSIIKNAHIARSEKLVDVMPDRLLSELINDGRNHYWLSTQLTETNREYEHVYRFLVNDLKVEVIRPEDLRKYFVDNQRFLPSRSNDWLVSLYMLYENVPTAFARNTRQESLLTTNIIKTHKGEFVSPCRRVENVLINNVFIPFNEDNYDDIHFVDPYLYEKCRHFFDDILQIQKPNQYEIFLKEFKKNIDNGYVVTDKRHISDVKSIIKYLKYDDYEDEIRELIRKDLKLRCKDGQNKNPYSQQLFLPVSRDGVDIEEYYLYIPKKISFVDMDYYSMAGITPDDICSLGVMDSIIVGEGITHGTYMTSNKGKNPDWWTLGLFRWKFTLDSLKDVLAFISNNPSNNNSIIKSNIILQVLKKNESKLRGTVNIGGVTKNLENETCELIKVLNGERIFKWNNKWLFTDSFELVSARDISKYELNEAIYGKFDDESIIPELLGFQKTKDEEADIIRKALTQKQIDVLFENELQKKYGLSIKDLTSSNKGFKSGNGNESTSYMEFPIRRIRSWEALKKHVAETLTYANPTKYESVVRTIRVSNRPKDIREYLKNSYQYDYSRQFACQICHEPTLDIEAVEIFKKPDVELDAMNLCLCPNCATKYRAVRDESKLMESLKQEIITKDNNSIVSGDQVVLAVKDLEIWFTQTHFAEVRELINLMEETKTVKNNSGTGYNSEHMTDSSAYSELIGKTLRRRIDGFVGQVTNVDNQWIYVTIIDSLDNDKIGTETKIALKFYIDNKKKYEVI